MSALARLFRPRSIAVVGGGAWCEAVLKQCRRSGHAGPLYAVHPTRPGVAGHATVPDVESLPESPDATFIGVNRDATLNVVRSLAARGAGGAVCFANGFAESADGVERQRELLEVAGPVALLGPNCYGFLNNLDGVALWPDQHGCVQVTRGVAIVTQSSNIALNLTMQRRGLPIAYLVTCGNQAQQGLAAISRTLLDDDRTTALGLYVEGFGDLRELEQLAQHAGRLGKPIIVLKSGRSDAARQATLSHTASLAGSDAGATALMQRLGLTAVASLAALIETLKVMHVFGACRGSGPNGTLQLASLSCSGGEAALVADSANALEARRSSLKGVSQNTRLAFPLPGVERQARLRTVLGPRIAIANPLDYDTGVWRDGDALQSVFVTMSGADIDVTLLVLDFPRGDRCDAHEWENVIAALERAARETGTRYAVVASLPDNLPESMAERLMLSGIVPLAGIEDALTALRAAADGSRGPGDDAAMPLLLARSRPATDTTGAPQGMQLKTLLTESDAKRVLADHGLSIPAGVQVSSPDEAAAAASRIGFPVVLKGEGFAHKSENGAVVVGLCDPESVAGAATAMPATSFLVEQQIPAGAVELLIGVVRDEAHGFVLTLAAGGVYTEVMDDSASLLLPTTRKRIDRALSSLRTAALIDGARGRSGASRDVIIEAVLAVQRYIMANALHVLEVEINPLLCTRHAAVALDALIVTTDSSSF